MTDCPVQRQFPVSPHTVLKQQQLVGDDKPGLLLLLHQVPPDPGPLSLTLREKEMGQRHRLFRQLFITSSYFLLPVDSLHQPSEYSPASTLGCSPAALWDVLP